MIKNCQEKKGQGKKQKAKTINIYFSFFWNHNKYIQQIMQNGEWKSYRQQDAKLLHYSRAAGMRHAATEKAGRGLIRKHNSIWAHVCSFISLISVVTA